MLRGRWQCPQEDGCVPRRVAVSLGSAPKLCCCVLTLSLFLCPRPPALLSPRATRCHPLPTATHGCMGQVRAHPQPHPASKDTFVTWLWLPRAAGSFLPRGPGEAKWQRAPSGVPSSAPEGLCRGVAGRGGRMAFPHPGHRRGHFGSGDSLGTWCWQSSVPQGHCGAQRGWQPAVPTRSTGDMCPVARRGWDGGTMQRWGRAVPRRAASPCCVPVLRPGLGAAPTTHPSVVPEALRWVCSQAWCPPAPRPAVTALWHCSPGCCRLWQGPRAGSCRSRAQDFPPLPWVCSCRLLRDPNVPPGAGTGSWPGWGPRVPPRRWHQALPTRRSTPCASTRPCPRGSPSHRPSVPAAGLVHFEIPSIHLGVDAALRRDPPDAAQRLSVKAPPEEEEDSESTAL